MKFEDMEVWERSARLCAYAPLELCA